MGIGVHGGEGGGCPEVVAPVGGGIGAAGIACWGDGATSSACCDDPTVAAGEYAGETVNGCCTADCVAVRCGSSDAPPVSSSIMVNAMRESMLWATLL